MYNETVQDPTPIYVFSGPSGCGKTTLCHLLESRQGATYSISATTRPKRPGERDGVDYHFVSPEEFRRDVEADAFLEWEEVHDNLYGTPKGPILKGQADRRLVVLDVDVKGALAVKRKMPEAILIFIMPPSWEELEKRLVSRGKDSPEVIKKRLINARRESEYRFQYDHIVLNDDLERTYREIAGIIATHSRELMRAPPASTTPTC